MRMNPYILFKGNCEEALNFYTKALNGTIKDLMRFEGSPMENQVPDKNQVMHATFEAPGVFFMASDGNQGTEGGMVQLSLSFDNANEQKQVFEALSEAGTVTFPLQETFWGATFGMLTDQFGVQWMLDHETAPNPLEQKG